MAIDPKYDPFRITQPTSQTTTAKTQMDSNNGLFFVEPKPSAIQPAPKPKTTNSTEATLVKPPIQNVVSPAGLDYYSPRMVESQLGQFQNSLNSIDQLIANYQKKQSGIAGMSGAQIAQQLRNYGVKDSGDSDYEDPEVRSNNEVLLSKYLDDAINQQLKKQDAIGKQILTVTQGGYKQQEKELTKGLTYGEQELNKLIDERLGLLIGETQRQANELRTQTGQVAADQGLTRSTFAQRAQEDVALQEQNQLAQTRLEGQQAHNTIANFRQKTLEGIQNRREQLQNQFSLDQVKTAQDLAFTFDAGALQSYYQTELAKLQEDAADSGLLGGLLGGLVEGVVGIFT